MSKQASKQAPQSPAAVQAVGTPDQQLEAGRHDRGYDPSKSAKRAQVSSSLNSDAERYKRGPGAL